MPFTTVRQSKVLTDGDYLPLTPFTLPHLRRGGGEQGRQVLMLGSSPREVGLTATHTAGDAILKLGKVQLVGQARDAEERRLIR